ncbi:hypothetical protein [Aneurinibacillus aneurinilyticus]|uniref:hypothetical protein n=1 Tax=Aneurinibacillus aneurinilyticus TaxID=1391 RepID=UPI00366FBA37
MQLKRMLFIIIYYFGAGYLFARIFKALFPTASTTTFSLSLIVFILLVGVIEVKYISKPFK